MSETNLIDPDVFKSLTPGVRLKMVILQYFQHQKSLCAITGIPVDTMSKYTTGRIDITGITAMKMQDLAGINADFLLNGNLPMMLDGAKGTKSYEVKFQGDAPIPTPIQQYNANEISDTKKGVVPNNVFNKRGSRQILSPQGRINVVDITINGIEQGISVFMEAPEFVEKYKQMFPLKLNCYIILDKDYQKGDDIFMSVDNEFYFAIYISKNTFLDCIDEKPISINSDNVKIYGAYYSSIIKGRLL